MSMETKDVAGLGDNGAEAIASGLATVGGVVGGCMLAGLSVAAAAPVAIGCVCGRMIAKLFED